jgi:hypothetical protein
MSKLRLVSLLLGGLLALAAVTAVSASTQFQSYRNPQQTARKFQTQLNHAKGFKSVKVFVYNPTLLIAKGYMRIPGTARLRFRSNVYKASTYRLYMVTSLPDIGGPVSRSYVDTKFPV